jgi:hypothetical protein
MSCEEELEGDGKLPSVDHGRRTDRGRDKKLSVKKTKTLKRKPDASCIHL